MMRIFYFLYRIKKAPGIFFRGFSLKTEQYLHFITVYPETVSLESIPAIAGASFLASKAKTENSATPAKE